MKNLHLNLIALSIFPLPTALLFITVDYTMIARCIKHFPSNRTVATVLLLHF
jgi:hypothetical protein